MNLRNSEASGNFYESFSDLIFATMAIFALLMIIFLTLVQPLESTENLEQELTDTQEQLKQAKEEAEKQAQQAAATEAKLKAKPIDLAIAVDGSSSMSETLNAIQTSIEFVAEVASRLAPTFRLSIVIYRDRESTQLFTLTEINSTSQGIKSAGMNKLNTWLYEKVISVRNLRGGKDGQPGGQSYGESRYEDRFNPLHSIADIQYGIKLATSQLNKKNSEETQKVLIVIGDMGPWERPNSQSAADNFGLQKQKDIFAMMKTFSSPETHHIMTLFTGKGNHGLNHRRETIAFFKGLAKIGGERGKYSDDASQVAATVVEAVIGDTKPKP